ncbi:hypothetical protein J2Z18_005876, partial [Paenibacillus lactis]|nr:hypothetical protein [Paenibacillus lactis]
EVQQCMELTNTNRSRAYPKSFLKESSLRKHKDKPTKVKKSFEADSDYFGGARKDLRI